jgi:hypothetical protein
MDSIVIPSLLRRPLKFNLLLDVFVTIDSVYGFDSYNSLD